MNSDLLNDLAAWIESNPECYDQHSWRKCLAGLTVAIAHPTCTTASCGYFIYDGNRMVGSVMDVARRALGISTAFTVKTAMFHGSLKVKPADVPQWLRQIAEDGES